MSAEAKSANVSIPMPIDHSSRGTGGGGVAPSSEALAGAGVETLAVEEAKVEMQIPTVMQITAKYLLME